MREITYSTRPLKVGDIVHLNKLQAGDYTSIIPFLLSRTDLDKEEILELDVNDLGGILAEIGEAIKRSLNLDNLGKQL